MVIRNYTVEQGIVSSYSYFIVPVLFTKHAMSNNGMFLNQSGLGVIQDH